MTCRARIWKKELYTAHHLQRRSCNISHRIREWSVIKGQLAQKDVYHWTSLIMSAMMFWCVHILEDAYGASALERDDLISTRLVVPAQIDFASGVGLVGRMLSNYGNPADVSLEHRFLNLSLSQSHWPLLPFLSWSYSARVPLKIGVGAPVGEGYVATTLLKGYLFHSYSKLEEQSHRGLLGGDIQASYKRELGVSGNWLTTSRALTKTVRTSAEDELLFGLTVGGSLGSRHGWVARFDTHSHGEFESRRLEFSIIFPNHSLGYVHTDHHRPRGRVMWNRGFVLRASRQRHSIVKPLSLWWQGRLSLTTGRAAGGGYLGWDIECPPWVEDCEEWTRLTVFEYEARIGGEYRWRKRSWTLAAQAGVIGSTDHCGFFWNEGIFRPTDWGCIGLAASFARQICSNQQWVYAMGYEHILPYLRGDRVDLEDIGGHFVTLGFHQCIEWRYTF